jgi:hypothetical protein
MGGKGGKVSKYLRNEVVASRLGPYPEVMGAPSKRKMVVHGKRKPKGRGTVGPGIVQPLTFYWPEFFFHRSNSAKLAKLHPFFMNSWATSSSAVARLRTSTQRHTLRNDLSSLLSLSGFLRRGVPLVAIKYKAFSGSSLRYGGSDSIISMAMIPRDQTSTRGPYSFCLTTSGAIQYGVPTMVARLLFDSVSLAQNPKSAIQTS